MIAAGLLVAATGQVLFDTLVALAIAVFVVVRAIALGRQALAVLGRARTHRSRRRHRDR